MVFLPFHRETTLPLSHDIQPLDLYTALCLRVDGEQYALHFAGALRRLIPAGQAAQEFIDGVPGTNPQRKPTTATAATSTTTATMAALLPISYLLAPECMTYDHVSILGSADDAHHRIRLREPNGFARKHRGCRGKCVAESHSVVDGLHGGHDAIYNECSEQEGLSSCASQPHSSPS